MSNTVDLDVKCEDFLRDNPHLYAHKARRKKIALINIKVANRHSDRIRIDLGATTLVSGGQEHDVEPPGTIIRKFSEFTWDFVFFAVLDLNPLLVVVDVFFFLTGPLYNWRLKRQLRLLSDTELAIGPGESKQAILGFRGVTKSAAQLRLSYCLGKADKQIIKCEV